MKKTVIIAIFLIYLASIVAVQLFGVPATLPETGVYITGIEITGLQLTGRGANQDKTINEPKEDSYWFNFIESDDPNGYTADVESLAKNPNRVKVEYTLYPSNASKDYLIYVVDNDAVVVLQSTDELVFLEKGTKVTLTLRESKANQEAQDTIVIRAR